MMAEVAQALVRHDQRERFSGDQELVFCDPLGRHLGYRSLTRRYKESLARVKLRPLRFHDLRHTLGTRAIRHADPREVMEWMGHADLATTQKYLAYNPRGDAARRVSGRCFRCGRQRRLRAGLGRTLLRKGARELVLGHLATCEPRRATAATPSDALLLSGDGAA